MNVQEILWWVLGILPSVNAVHKIECQRRLAGPLQGILATSGAGVSNGGPGGIRTRDLPEIWLKLANRTFFGPR